VRLAGYGKRRTSEISGGQQQRVALARALVNRPAVLLLDEPLAALDLKIRQHMLAELKRIHAETGTTFIYVTHDQDEAMVLSDRIVLMNKGRIEQIGSPRQIYEEPATSFAYSFIGNVNAFRGKVEGEHVRVGGDLLPIANSDFTDGDPVIAYARPHDTEIIVNAQDQPGIAARINRVLTNGAVSRVELIANGPVRGEAKDYFEVEVGSEELSRLGLALGQSVRLRSRRLSVFRDQASG
jgi:sulfate transport system ATP-binding protein